MSNGKCGVHHYANISQAKIDQILDALRKNGSTVTGNNPWNVDTHKFGIKLQGTWDSGSQTLSIIVTDKDFFVPCSKIWDTIDPLINHISSMSDKELHS